MLKQVQSLGEELLLFIPEGLTEEEHHIIGNAIYFPLSTGNKLKLWFDDQEIQQHYNTIILEIVNPNNGKLDRIDLSLHGYYIWCYNRKLEWYGSFPGFSVIEDIKDQIADYYALFEPCASQNNL